MPWRIVFVTRALTTLLRIEYLPIISTKDNQILSLKNKMQKFNSQSSILEKLLQNQNSIFSFYSFKKRTPGLELDLQSHCVILHSKLHNFSNLTKFHGPPIML